MNQSFLKHGLGTSDINQKLIKASISIALNYSQSERIRIEEKNNFPRGFIGVTIRCNLSDLLSEHKTSFLCFLPKAKGMSTLKICTLDEIPTSIQAK